MSGSMKRYKIVVWRTPDQEGGAVLERNLLDLTYTKTRAKDLAASPRYGAVAVTDHDGCVVFDWRRGRDVVLDCL